MEKREIIVTLSKKIYQFDDEPSLGETKTPVDGFVGSSIAFCSVLSFLPWIWILCFSM